MVLEKKWAFFNDIFSRDILYCLLPDMETLKTSILRVKEICESSKGNRQQPDMGSHFIEQVIDSACAAFGSNM